MKDDSKKLDLKRIRKKAEELCKNNTLSIIKNYSNGDVYKLIHELEVHQIELELINEELVASKKREIELANNKYENLYNFAPSGYFTLSENGKILSLNFSGAEMLGKERSYLINSNFNSFVAVNSKATFNSFLKKVAKNNIKETCELWLDYSSKKPLYIYLSGNIELGSKDILLTAVDITERKKAETVQSILLNISNNVSLNVELEDFIKIIQQELGYLIDTSNFFIAIYNEKTETLSLPYYQNEKENVTEFRLKNTLTGHVIKTGKSLLINKEGIKKIDLEPKFHKIGVETEIWLGVPLIINEKVIGALVVQSYTNPNAYTEKDKEVLEIISQQISISIELKLQEDELIKAKERAEESDRLKSAFLANMSHEIRTPMSGILGFSELLKNQELTSEKQAKYIDIIEKSGKRLLNTINDIIDISKIEAGQVVVSYSEVNIPTLLEELFEFFKLETKKKDIKLEVSCSLTDEFNNIKTDTKLLNSVLVNLIKNALKFTVQGNIKFGCVLKDKFIEFFVEDTGVGIPKDRQKSVFDRFVQADIEDRAAYQGSGLGLAISKSYVEMLGGQMKLDSILGKGSKFSFTLPLENDTKKTFFKGKQ
jgi:PAS domain S-box-containing protein